MLLVSSALEWPAVVWRVPGLGCHHCQPLEWPAVVWRVPELGCHHCRPLEWPAVVWRVASHDVTIYKASVTIHDPNRKIYYRPAEGDCGCQQQFDGQDLLLFNLDNRHLFYYGFLFGYMHSMLEGKYPLATCHRACSQYHLASSTTQLSHCIFFVSHGTHLPVSWT